MRSFIVNGISEKGLNVNQKVEIVNFQGGTCEKVLERLNDIHDQGKDR